MKRRELLATLAAGALTRCLDSAHAPAAALLTEAELTALRQRFNQDQAKLRLLALLSPT